MLTIAALLALALPTGQMVEPQDSLIVEAVFEAMMEDAKGYRLDVLPRQVVLMTGSVEETVGVARRAGVEVVTAQDLNDRANPIECESVRCFDVTGVLMIESFAVTKKSGEAIVRAEYQVPMRRGVMHCPREVEWTLAESEKGAWSVVAARNLREC